MGLALESDIRFLKGVGEKRAQSYHKLGIRTIGDLLRHYPREYIDLTQPRALRDCPPDEACVVRATVLQKGAEQHIRKGMSITKVLACDENGDRMLLTFFNSHFQVEALRLEEEYLFCGRLEPGLTQRQMSAPLVFSLREGQSMMPVYPLTAGLSGRVIASAVHKVLAEADLPPDPLPQPIRQRQTLAELGYALRAIHFPQSAFELETARKRLIFDEFFLLSLAMERLKSLKKQASVAPFVQLELEPFLAALPFRLTEAQRRALEDCRADLGRGVPMSRLIQGDVGSGKTVVAAACCYLSWKNGAQSVLMAPTDLLARQHYETFSRLLGPFGIRVGLLTGSLSAREKRALLQDLAEGCIDVCVGTHALFSAGVEYRDLRLVIADEQHRFGVAQRAALAQKGEACHTLVMSATPIPRTLSLIIYGELDISIIDQLPPGREPVLTYAISTDKLQRAYGFIRRHLEEGLQAYIVCPMIEEREGASSVQLRAAASYVQQLQEGPFAGFRLGLVHSRQKPKEKEQAMEDFLSGKTQLLVSTTVVEVGVDVPNAVIMMIENAERFGLSQLHQLRGRVGRGSRQSYCILVSDHPGEGAQRRLKMMCRTNNGFEIAEEDLRLRGPGDFLGHRQHGLPQMKIADLGQDVQLLQSAREEAQALLAGTRDFERDYPEFAHAIGRLLEDTGERLN